MLEVGGGRAGTPRQHSLPVSADFAEQCVVVTADVQMVGSYNTARTIHTGTALESEDRHIVFQVFQRPSLQCTEVGRGFLVEFRRASFISLRMHRSDSGNAVRTAEAAARRTS